MGREASGGELGSGPWKGCGTPLKSPNAIGGRQAGERGHLTWQKLDEGKRGEEPMLGALLLEAQKIVGDQEGGRLRRAARRGGQA